VAYERAKADFEDAQAAAVAAGVTVPITSVNTSSQVSATEADVNSARAGIQAAKQQFEAAKAQLQEAEANNSKAQNDLGRYKQLVDKQEISAQQYDQALTTAKASAAAVEDARANDHAALNLQYTKVVAPVNGVVSNRTVEVGQNVAPGQELMKLINLDDIWITANFKETQLRQKI